MLNEEHSAASNVHCLMVNGEFMNQSKIESPVSMSKLKKTIMLKRSHAWTASVTDRMRTRQNLLNRPDKGISYAF